MTLSSPRVLWWWEEPLWRAQLLLAVGVGTAAGQSLSPSPQRDSFHRVGEGAAERASLREGGRGEAGEGVGQEREFRLSLGARIRRLPQLSPPGWFSPGLGLAVLGIPPPLS